MFLSEKLHVVYAANACSKCWLLWSKMRSIHSKNWKHNHMICLTTFVLDTIILCSLGSMSLVLDMEREHYSYSLNSEKKRKKNSGKWNSIQLWKQKCFIKWKLFLNLLSYGVEYLHSPYEWNDRSWTTSDNSRIWTLPLFGISNCEYINSILKANNKVIPLSLSSRTLGILRTNDDDR